MGMYCKQCRYDLRGQDTPRCPECGRDFDPADPRSFLYYPTRLRNFRLEFNKIRGPIAIILTSLWVPLMILGPPCLDALRHRHGSLGGYHSVTYLKMITIQRIIWQHEDPEVRDFDRRLAVRDLRPQLSPYTEPAKIKWRYNVRRAVSRSFDYSIPTAVYALLMVMLLRGRRRRIALCVLIICIATVPASRHARRIGTYLVPGSYAYLDDYVYINGVDLTPANSQPHTTIVAYDRRSFEGEGLRIVGFASGYTAALRDDQAKPLFEANGLKYPAVSKPDADE